MVITWPAFEYGRAENGGEEAEEEGYYQEWYGGMFSHMIHLYCEHCWRRVDIEMEGVNCALIM